MTKIKAKDKSQNGIIEAKGKKAHTQSTHATLRQKEEKQEKKKKKKKPNEIT